MKQQQNGTDEASAKCLYMAVARRRPDWSIPTRAPPRNTSCNNVEHKLLLTLGEAAEYTGLGVKRFRRIVNEDPDFVEEVTCVIGARRYFRRKRLEEYSDSCPGWEL